MSMNQFIALAPFDLHTLNLFRLVAEERHFTRAARKAGLTRSAITRRSATVPDVLTALLDSVRF